MMMFLENIKMLVQLNIDIRFRIFCIGGELVLKRDLIKKL